MSLSSNHVAVDTYTIDNKDDGGSRQKLQNRSGTSIRLFYARALLFNATIESEFSLITCDCSTASNDPGGAIVLTVMASIVDNVLARINSSCLLLFSEPPPWTRNPKTTHVMCKKLF